jgi:hypothetical protein
MTLYFVPSPGRFLAGRVSLIRGPSLKTLRDIVRAEPLAWVTA